MIATKRSVGLSGQVVQEAVSLLVIPAEGDCVNWYGGPEPNLFQNTAGRLKGKGIRNGKLVFDNIYHDI